jgi:L-fuculose-phosphate aldolase
MKFELLHPADQIVMIMQRIYEGQMTTTSGGNLSIKDENGDIWITPGGIDKGSLTRADICRVTPDGKIYGPHKPSVELPFHKKIYEIRSDAGAVLHAHPPALVAFSIVGKIPDTRVIPNAHLICGKVGLAEYDVPGSTELGEKIARKFIEGNDVVMMENHGLVTLGRDLFQAFMRFETLEFCARLEIGAKRLGSVTSLSDQQLAIARTKQHVDMPEFTPKSYSSEEKDARRTMCEIIHRAYKQKLFTSTQGTFSYKLSNDSFLITPYGVDRMYMEPADIVRIDGSSRERGKIPSRSVLLHKEIYATHENVKSIAIAHPPNIMSYGLSDERFDSRTIPESYIMLRDIVPLPFGINITDPEKLSTTLCESIPVVMIENDSVVVAGTSLINAFDRLEVAEFSAKALLDAAVIGELKPINQAQVEEIKIAFDLK